ncbi:MAG: ABC transporter ATP-binding protein, partial [Clostridia bacterium]
MLQIKGVSKTYKTKNKILVKALDDVSLDISEKGMVFVLGKSGSGKSTLLNVLGGLDSADCGEINICGKSSKNFSQSDFDSYRNTFIGFIFQEYNILNEFSVGANIALAMELQGKKATDEALNKILEQVDLSGYADRKPNTLSGGQKQRVAIARALIKEPEIIMADEPTGALDSNTGKQVFDTLKKLSKEKLVIVVSHDREFAEQYADRIIELADGKIISDVIKHTVDSSKKSLGVSIIGDKIIHIKKGYSLTETDLKLINEYLKNNAQSDSLISLDGRANSEFKKAAKINDIGAREVFDEAKSGDIQLKSYDVSKFKLIKSRLPFKNSAKIAASGLKTKPFRLFMTILLSTIAFTLFGLASTMSTYNKADASLSSINDSKVNYVAIKQMIKMGDGTYDYYENVSISDKELQKLREKFPNLHFTPLYPGTLNSGKNTPLSNIADFEALEGHETFSYYFKRFSGIMPIDEALIAKNEFKLIGSYPANDDEVVITDYIYEHYKRAGYANDIQDITISTENDLIGRTITLNISGSDKEMKIVGILNTNLDGSRYEKFKSKPNTNTNPNATVTDNVMNYVLFSELDTLISQSYHSAAFVSPENFKKIAVLKNDFIETNGNRYNIELRIDDNYMSSRYVSSLKNVEKSDLIMFDKNKTELADDEIMLSLNSIIPIIKNITQNEGKLIDIDNVNYDELKNKIVTVGLYVRNSSKVK